MKKFSATVLLNSLFVCLALSVFPQSEKKDVVFRAIEDEMNRSIKELKWKSFDKPYFLEYSVEDVDTLIIQAAFGALKRSSRVKNRVLFTHVRVGSYESDSSTRFPFPLPLDDDYDALRRAVWFSTDASYKRAVDQFEMIKAVKKNQAVDEEEDKISSFSKEKPVVSVAAPGKLTVDQKLWENRVKDWSAMFRSYPQFRDSYFNFYVRQTNSYLINTEGTRILEPKFLITVDIHTIATTDDNSTITPYRHIFATSFDDLMTVEEINQEIKGLIDEVKIFESAKEFKETYIGPAIFTEGASAQLFLQILAPELSNTGGGNYPTPRGYSGTGFYDRIGRRVLPTFLSIVDDPTISKFGDTKLAGSYKVDREGVPAKPLTLVDKGILKTLFATRNPSKKIPRSNGRARGTGAHMSNLIIKSTDGKTFEELKEALIAECKDQGLPFGVIFRENNATFSTFSNAGSVVAYKIYVEDGREELFKGASVSDLSVRELRRIMAAGDDPFPFSLLINSSYNGTGTPASIVAPSVLLEEINLKKSGFAKRKPDIVTHPFFDKSGKKKAQD